MNSDHSKSLIERDGGYGKEVRGLLAGSSTLLVAKFPKTPRRISHRTGKNGFVTATKLGTTNKFFVAATKNFAAATKRFVDRTKHFAVVTKYFCYPYFNK